MTWKNKLGKAFGMYLAFSQVLGLIFSLSMSVSAAGSLPPSDAPNISFFKEGNFSGLRGRLREFIRFGDGQLIKLPFPVRADWIRLGSDGEDCRFRLTSADLLSPGESVSSDLVEVAPRERIQELQSALLIIPNHKDKRLYFQLRLAASRPGTVPEDCLLRVDFLAQADAPLLNARFGLDQENPRILLSNFPKARQDEDFGTSIDEENMMVLTSDSFPPFEENGYHNINFPPRRAQFLQIEPYVPGHDFRFWYGEAVDSGGIRHEWKLVKAVPSDRGDRKVTRAVYKLDSSVQIKGLSLLIKTGTKLHFALTETPLEDGDEGSIAEFKPLGNGLATVGPTPLEHSIETLSRSDLLKRFESVAAHYNDPILKDGFYLNRYTSNHDDVVNNATGIHLVAKYAVDRKTREGKLVYVRWAEGTRFQLTAPKQQVTAGRRNPKDRLKLQTNTLWCEPATQKEQRYSKPVVYTCVAANVIINAWDKGTAMDIFKDGSFSWRRTTPSLLKGRISPLRIYTYRIEPEVLNF